MAVIDTAIPTERQMAYWVECHQPSTQQMVNHNFILSREIALCMVRCGGGKRPNSGEYNCQGRVGPISIHINFGCHMSFGVLRWRLNGLFITFSASEWGHFRIWSFNLSIGLHPIASDINLVGHKIFINSHCVATQNTFRINFSPPNDWWLESSRLNDTQNIDHRLSLMALILHSKCTFICFIRIPTQYFPFIQFDS